MLNTQTIQCPNCGEMIELVIDPSEQYQKYIEDCFVCCRPIHLIVNIDDSQDINIQALSENEDTY